MQQAGRLVIVSAPSGAGKTTLVQHLLSVPELGLSFSVSATSRPIRPNEVDGRDYHFISAQAFQAKVAAGEFLEWEEVYPGRFYGSLRSDVDAMLAAGRNVIFDVDVVGGLNIKKAYAQRALAIFIEPPSIAVLEQRLRHRNSESEETLNIRIAKAKYEMEFHVGFDCSVLNEDLNMSKKEIERLVKDFLAAR